ncbi:MAG: LbetaH domain-containing protein [Planctomycetota bacterium]
MSVHHRADVDPSARLGRDVSVGAFSTVGPDVTIGDGCVLMPHVVITGRVRIGRNNVFHPTAAVGEPAQDVNPPADDGWIEIGEENIFREAVTAHRPKMPGGVTRIGSRCRFHFSAHVGHDSEVEDHVHLDSGFVLAGHTKIEEGARCGSNGGTHQFTTVGKKARVGSHCPVTRDVIPYMEVDGNHFRVVGIHRDAVRHLPWERSLALEDARILLFESGLPRIEALTRLERNPTPEVAEITAFVRRIMEGRQGRALEAER